MSERAPNGEGELVEAPGLAPDRSEGQPQTAPVGLADRNGLWLYCFQVSSGLLSRDPAIRLWTEGVDRLPPEPLVRVLTERDFNNLRNDLFRLGLDLSDITRVPYVEPEKIT